MRFTLLWPQGSFFEFFNLRCAECMVQEYCVLLRRQHGLPVPHFSTRHPCYKLKNHSFWKCMEFLITKQNAPNNTHTHTPLQKKPDLFVGFPYVPI